MKKSFPLRTAKLAALTVMLGAIFASQATAAAPPFAPTSV
jgi:hypothetical protein